MNILLLEDDNLQREYLKRIIQKKYIDIRIYESDSVKLSKKYIEEKEIDLFLVDINLSDGSGLEFIKEVRTILKYKLTGVIFITNEVYKIIDAFKNTHCYDYIVKPFNIEDVYKCIDVFYENRRIDFKEGDSFIIKLESGLSAKIYEDDIVFIEYANRTCKIYTIKNVYMCKSITLSKILKLIKSKNIVQSHKSYLINTKYIEGIDRLHQRGWEVHFVPISQIAQLSVNYKEHVLDIWGNNE